MIENATKTSKELETIHKEIQKRVDQILTVKYEPDVLQKKFAEIVDACVEIDLPLPPKIIEKP